MPIGPEKYFIETIKQLLADSSEDVNPFADYTPHIPEGESVDFYSNEIHKLEDTGVKEI